MMKFLTRERPVDEEDREGKKARVEAAAAAAAAAAPPNDRAALPLEPPADEATAELIKELTDPEWRAALQRECAKPYFAKLAERLQRDQRAHTVFPPRQDIFAAFNAVPPSKVRVVIIGQDPYHGPGQAHGLCFSVRRGVAVPPSLRNIYKELETDVEGFTAPGHGNLESWAEQGIFLLNATMTVQQAKANSHADFGWQTFTDAVIKVLNEQAQGVVFILWGGFAQKKGKAINRSRHHVLEAAHPSPLSVTKFRGCKVFSKTNAYLVQKGKPPIDWTVPA